MERKLGKGDKGESTPGWQEAFGRIGEIPFTSQRKMMWVRLADHGNGDAHVLFAKGAPDVLLAQCTPVRRGEAAMVLDAALHAQVLAVVASMTDDAVVVDIGASNVERLLELMQRYQGSHQDFDAFVVPKVPALKQQQDTVATLQK